MVKNFIRTIVLASLMVVPTMSFAAQLQTQRSYTLREAYALALKQSETIKINEERIKEAEGRWRQSFSTLLPKINFVYSEDYADDNSTSVFSKGVSERKFTFSQPLFSGFKEFAAIAGSRAQKRQYKFQQRRAQDLLFIDVADAFYLFAWYQEDLATLQSIAQALKDRLDDLKRRGELGRSRESEVANAQLRFSRNEAAIAQIQSEFSVVKELLQFLTGTEIESVNPQFLEYENVPVLMADEIAKKAQRRPDVQAAREAAKVASKETSVAAAEFWPHATVDGNRYIKRENTSEDNGWDVTLKVEVPVFQGGENIGRYQEQKSLARQEELRFKETQRRAELEIEQMLTQWTWAKTRQEAWAAAATAAEKNYALQVEDYGLNRVNNLEVLDALEQLEETRREFSSVDNELKRLYWKYKVATGEEL